MIDLNGTLIAQILNFLILLAILAKFAWKPLIKALDERQERIAADLETAEQERIAAQELKKEYQEQLAAARAQAQAIVDKATKLAEQTKEEMLAQSRAEHTRLIQAAQEEISRERERALSELRRDVVVLSMAAAGKVIGAKLDNEANAKLVSEFIDQLDDKKIGGLPC